MGRPIGSKNKPKDVKIIKNSASIVKINLEKQIEAAPVTKNSMRGWINWGQKNNYPQMLSDLYYASPTHRACVDFAVAAIVGRGIDYEKMSLKQEEVLPNYYETWDELLEKVALDYVLYGAYSIQIIKNKDGKTYSFYHQSYADVRSGERDEDGVITSYWISSDWTAQQKYPPVELPAFGMQEDEKIAQGKPYLFVYQTYSPDLLYYQLPLYSSALKAIQAEIELIRYDLRSITNNFSASGILSMAGVEDDEQRDMILNNLEKTFQGSDNANSLMVIFRDNNDENTINFTKFDKDINNVNIFSANNERTLERILSAHRIPSKQLIGYDADSAMLGGEGNLLNVAYNLYMSMTGYSNQKKITNIFNRMLKLNGININLVLKPLELGLTNASTTNDVNNVDIDKEQYSSENIEEKVVSEEV